MSLQGWRLAPVIPRHQLLLMASLRLLSAKPSPRLLLFPFLSVIRWLPKHPRVSLHFWVFIIPPCPPRQIFISCRPQSASKTINSEACYSAEQSKLSLSLQFRDAGACVSPPRLLFLKSEESSGRFSCCFLSWTPGFSDCHNKSTYKGMIFIAMANFDLKMLGKEWLELQKTGGESLEFVIF